METGVAAGGQEYTDIVYETAEGIAKITISNRPRCATRSGRPPCSLSHAFDAARDDPGIGVIILTGAARRRSAPAATRRSAATTGTSTPTASAGDVLDLQVQIRRTPKPVIAIVAGDAIGGGRAARARPDHRGRQRDLRADRAQGGVVRRRLRLLAARRDRGAKKAREIWYLCRQYTAQQALDMGLVNTVVPLQRLEEETVAWA